MEWFNVYPNYSISTDKCTDAFIGIISRANCTNIEVQPCILGVYLYTRSSNIGYLAIHQLYIILYINMQLFY